jgi:hypothetical protein
MEISGKIPEYIRLYQNIALKDNLLIHKSTQIEEKDRIIKCNLSKIEPGKQRAVV